MLFPHWSPWEAQICKTDGMVTRQGENVLSVEFGLLIVVVRVVTVMIGCSILPSAWQIAGPQ